MVLFNGFGSETISIRAFARSVGVSDSAIHRALKEGRITAVITLPSGRRVLNEDLAREEWNACHVQRAGETVEGGVSQLTVEKTRLTKAKHQLLRLELDEMQGRCHHEDDIRAVVGDMFAAFKANMRAIPPKLAGIIAGITDPAEVLRLLTEQAEEALEELTDYDPELFRRNSRRRQARMAFKQE